MTRHTTIDELLAELSEERIAELILKRSDSDREAFEVDKVTVEGIEEFEKIVESYPVMKPMDVLTAAFGHWSVAYDIAKSGAAGGLKAVLDALNEHAKKQRAADFVRNVLSGFQVPERLRLLAEYVERYGHLLPSHYRTAGAGYLLMHFEKVIRHHLNVVAPAIRREVQRP